MQHPTSITLAVVAAFKATFDAVSPTVI